MNSSELADIASPPRRHAGSRLLPEPAIRPACAFAGAGRRTGKDVKYQKCADLVPLGAYYTESPWRGQLATEGGSLLINQAIHTLDLMQWFAGGDEGGSRQRGQLTSRKGKTAR
ncbi:MAG: Gfo/Idh/MocA family oxidoreductase [Enterobacter hormaechei]